jgi:energy-coupling factor transporter ATP-binding protein EcfA2
MADLDFGNIFSSITRSSESTIEANQQVFTPEVLSEVARKGLEQHRLIEEKITALVNLTNKDIDLSEMITTLRTVSLTYLPKV